MASSIMMQNMCNNQIYNDLGMYGSHPTQLTFTSFTPSPAMDGLPGGAIFMNPQTFPMPAMNYSASPSPQMIPLAYPPMMPLMDLTSITPPPVAPMGSFVPTAVPMMGYSIVPLASNGMPMLGLPQASSSYSSENMQFLLPELAFTHPQQTFSISRSCSPASDAVLPEMYEPVRQPVQEVSRERLPSEEGSSGSLDSTSTSGTTGVISKKELVENCLNEIDSIFGDRVQTTGMRGPTVMRIKVKTRPALELIVELLRAFEQNSSIVGISCPKSTKKGKKHIRGFLAYIQTSTVAEIAKVQRVFDEFNRTNQKNGEVPFKKLEVNPGRKTNIPF